MKIFITIFIVSVVGLFAEAPRKSPLTKYRQLWEKSLVTVPPPPEVKEQQEVVTPLDDYTLGGYTKTAQGYLVSLINMKNPKDRLTLAPGMPGYEDYQVLKVESNPLDYTSARVLMKVGNQQKWIGYEEKYLTLQKPNPQQNRQQPRRPQPTPQARPANNSQVKPPIPLGNTNANKSPTTTRQPRVRRVPAPPKK